MRGQAIHGRCGGPGPQGRVCHHPVGAAPQPAGYWQQQSGEAGIAERTAINTPIQGTAADIIKLAMVAVDQVLSKNGLPARLLLQVHDELVFELPPADLDACTGPIKAAMEEALEMDVPLVVNCAVGQDLAK